jgi:hypothetical protein
MLCRGARGAGAAAAASSLLRQGVTAGGQLLLLPGHAAGRGAEHCRGLHSPSSSRSHPQGVRQQTSSSARWQKWQTVDVSARAVGAVGGAVAAGAVASYAGSAKQVVHKGTSYFLVPMQEMPLVSSLFQRGAVMDWRVLPQQQGREAVAVASMVVEGEWAGLFGKLDMDGEVEWEEMQAGSVMKKRKKAMNKHKWKKRKKRDRSYDR